MYMGFKVFVSYKYSDRQVQPLHYRGFDTTVRDYVDLFQSKMDSTSHINKGEADDEDLSNFADETIASKLRDKIYDSSITVVFISPGMKSLEPEQDQWIPWEISYSLRQATRNDRTSRANGILAVTLPDQNGKYDYFIQEDTCPLCHCQTLHTYRLFQIMRKNMFNVKSPTRSDCNRHYGSRPFRGRHSYIHPLKWSDFLNDISGNLAFANELRVQITDFNITKSVE
jgi:hypothetical protein